MLTNIYRRIVAVAIWANVTGAAVLLLLVAVMNFDVIARGVFHAPFNGVIELVIFSMVLIVFLQLPDVVRTGRLTRSDGLLSYLGDSNPKAADVLRRIIDAMACIFMGMIAYTVWPEVVEAYHSCEYGAAFQDEGGLLAGFVEASSDCDYFGTPGIFTAPWWPARLAIFFGVTMACIIFGLKAILGPQAQLADADTKDTQ